MRWDSRKAEVTNISSLHWRLCPPTFSEGRLSGSKPCSEEEDARAVTLFTLQNQYAVTDFITGTRASGPVLNCAYVGCSSMKTKTFEDPRMNAKCFLMEFVAVLNISPV
eukprot:5722782-Amphidinium_carterae.1